MSSFWIKCLASGCFLGYSPIVSGTVGSLGGVLLFLLFAFCGLSWFIYALAVLLLYFTGVYVSSKIEKEVGQKDPGIVVIDEIVGMMLTYAAVPLNWKWLLLGFVLFRILDVWKPFPARHCERIGGGTGIMLDDVVSGIYACLALHLIIRLT